MKVAVIAGNGMGGTEKAAYLFAAELARRGYEVDALTDPDGGRANVLRAAGVRIHDVRLEANEFEGYLREARPDVIHNHTSGYADHREIYAALDRLGSKRPRLIETNVFGRLWDRHEGSRVDLRMFVSMASGCQAFLRPKLVEGGPSPDRHLVLYNPLPHFSSDKARSAAKVDRKSLGIPEDACVLARVGRPGHKWANWECEAFRQAKLTSPNLRLILMEPGDDLKADIAAGRYGEGIHVLAATWDHEFIDGIYRLSDAMLHASSFGESYGYTLAEGMREGLPVITRTTPWADNAQVELVSHRETGLVCGGVSGMARAIGIIAADDAKRRLMAQEGIRRVRSLSDLEGETDVLEDVLRFVVSGERGERMKARYEAWMEFLNGGFREREWNILERSEHNRMSYARARTYSVYRRVYVSLAYRYREMRNGMRS